MWIYKITNIQNNKVYIGQSIRPIKERFKRHMSDGLNNILDTHLARAIRKYGKSNFTIEEIDKATTQEELNIKEQFWIRYYDSIDLGYNETDAIYKCGGNTYKSKTPKEIEVIKNKIRKTKLGGLNPNARKVKMINTITNEIQIFDSQQQCADFLHLSSHVPISRRCRKEGPELLFNKYKFEYYNE